VLVGAAYLFEYERLDHRDGVSDSGARRTAHRASIYITGHEDLSTGVAIVETFYVQPRLDQPSDLRMLGELAVQSKLTGHVALKDGFTVAYDRTPPDGVKRYDTALEVSLIATF
jgi:putative salt-induced outer membrane protein YdiY